MLYISFQHWRLMTMWATKQKTKNEHSRLEV